MVALSDPGNTAEWACAKLLTETNNAPLNDVETIGAIFAPAGQRRESPRQAGDLGARRGVAG
jgi:hypothetical protein